jgi:FAD/FMN-containing dehydrogenase
VVTRVAVKLDVLPHTTATALLSLPSVAAALDAIRNALACDAGHLRAAEAMWHQYLRFTAKELGWSGAGVDLDQPMFLLLLLGGANDEALQDSLLGVFETTAAQHPGTTGIIAASERQAAELWRLREDTELVYRLHPHAPSYDVSVPLSQMESYVAGVQAGMDAIDPAFQPFVFGHFADGNLHILLRHTGALPPDIATRVHDVLYRDMRTLGGSFSAEHGVGSERSPAGRRSTKLALMAW